MRNILSALIVAAGIAVALSAASAPAEARWGYGWYGGGWGWRGGGWGSAALGFALASPYYGYGYYGYAPYGYYGYAPIYSYDLYYCGGCYDYY